MKKDSSMTGKQREKYSFWAGMILGGGFILITLSAGLSPSSTNWGVNQLGFLPVFWMFLTIVLMGLFCIPSVQYHVLRFADVVNTALAMHSPKFRRGLLFIFLLLTGCLFWLLREELPLFGDGSWLIRQVPLINDVSQIPKNFTNQPLVGFIVWNLFGLLRSLTISSSPTLAFQILSIVSGLGAIIFLLILARDLFDNIIDRWLFLFFVFCSGSCQLFFGNIENYAFSYFVLIVFIVYGVKYLHGQGSLILASISFGVLFPSHFGAIVFSPALAWLYFKGIRRKEIQAVLISFFVTVGVSGGLLYTSGYTWQTLIGVFDFSSFHRLSLTVVESGWQGYTLFSGKHFIELGNLFLEISPFALPLILLVFFTRLRSISWTNETWIFLLFLALGGGYMLFVFSPALGMSRDWITLISFPTGIIITSAYAVLHYLENPLIRRQILLIASGITFVSTISWVALNNNGDYALARFKVLSDGAYWGPNSKFSAYEELAILYRNRMDGKNAIMYYRKCLEVDSTRGRIWMGLAHVYSLMGDTVHEVECYRQAVENHTTFVDPYINLSRYYALRGLFDEALTVMRKGLNLNPDSPEANNIIGEYILQSGGKCEEALPYFLRAISIYPQYTQAYFNTGMCYHNLKKLEESKTYLTEYLRLERNPQNLAMIQKILRDPGQ